MMIVFIKHQPVILIQYAQVSKMHNRGFPENHPKKLLQLPKFAPTFSETETQKNKSETTKDNSLKGGLPYLS
jgi:hypothetical protein